MYEIVIPLRSFPSYYKESHNTEIDTMDTEFLPVDNPEVGYAFSLTAAVAAAVVVAFALESLTAEYGMQNSGTVELRGW